MNDKFQKVNAWHEEAMDFAEMAFFASRRNEYANYWKLLQRALNYEKAAAKVLKDILDVEPSRSIMYQGAIHFALNLDYYQEAETLLKEALTGNPPPKIKDDLERQTNLLQQRRKIRTKVMSIAQEFLDDEGELTKNQIKLALNSAIASAEIFYGKEALDQLLNRLTLHASLECKNLVYNPDYQIFEDTPLSTEWIKSNLSKISWTFWNAYKKYLNEEGLAAPTISKLDKLTDDILNRIGDPLKVGVWDKRGMVVGDVQSGKTSNYIGLINKAADTGFRIIIILTGLYENLRQQTQSRVDEGFSGFTSSPGEGKVIGVGKHRESLPVQPITYLGDRGDLSSLTLKNLPLNTNDYYAIVIKKNPQVLKNLLTWLHGRGTEDGDYRIIKNIPLLIIDDEADYASINVDKSFVSKINGYIRSTLGLFEQSAFIGYTATPFANVFISDFNKTRSKEIKIDHKKFRLGEDLFPTDFIINLASPSNYIGYTKVFNTALGDENSSLDALPMVSLVDDYESFIPIKHLKSDSLPTDLPNSLKYAINCFIIVCATRIARGQAKQHNSMLIHVSWYVNWINHIADITNEYLQIIKNNIRYDKQGDSFLLLRKIWENEFQNRSEVIAERLGYEDPRLIDHSWEEIEVVLIEAIEKIEVRAVHGPQKGLAYENTQALNYDNYPDGLSVIAVGGNKLSRGLTLSGLSISYFLRATKFYDTLLQMGRWFGYRPGYADVCRVFTTKELVTWYQYIGNATEELKEQFDIMDLAERTPKSFGLKVRSAPGMLMISAAAKIKGATDLNLSYSGELLETYILSKSIDVLKKNLNVVKNLIGGITPLEPVERRQGQPYIWEKISYKIIDKFLEDYETNQHNIRPDFLRSYIRRQLKNKNLTDWTVVLINNSTDKNPYPLETGSGILWIGKTMREEAKKEKNGITYSDSENYLIRQSHIISPPHEFLDISEDDDRYTRAMMETIQQSKTTPRKPSGKYIRKHRGGANALLLIYLLDPTGFNGNIDLPATGYAISLPKLERDETFPYKVNDVFMKDLFSYPEDAEENPEKEQEN